jgi:hypothetical protein
MRIAFSNKEANGDRNGLQLSLISGLHVTALCSLAVSHPLYEVLGQADHAPFFIAHQSRMIDVYLFVIAFSIALPLVLCLALWLVKQVSEKLASGLFVMLLFILVFAALLPLPEKWLHEPGKLPIILPAITASLGACLYIFTGWARSFVTIMSLAIVISPAMFLSTTSMQSILATEKSQHSVLAQPSRDLPDIVMIIFDELPLISLLDQDLGIDRVRYPNFHRLAESGTWYKNTTSLHYSTSYAITSLLVGEEYRKYLEEVHETPIAASGPIDRQRIPFSLFSLLEKHYQVFANELMTKLAPKSPETDIYVPPLKERILELLIDSTIVYLHLVSPENLRGKLSHIEGQWGGFTDIHPGKQERPEWPFEDSFNRASSFQQFIDSLQKRNAPAFYFLHSLLPHYPFVYNERGQIHSNNFGFLTMNFREATGSNDWPDEWTAALAQQAHLLQLGFTDLLLGRVLDRLEAQGMFQDSLIVVTSDHGTSYYWDRDHLPAKQLAEIQASGTVYVPLIVKLPGQTTGLVSNKPLQTTDIVPSLADILELEVSWPTSGLSALGAIQDDRERYSNLPEYFRIDSSLKNNSLALNRKFTLFGSNNTESVYKFGPHAEIIDRPLSDFPSSAASGKIRMALDDRNPSSDPDSRRLRAYVEGQILLDQGGNLETAEQALAIAVNGVIRSTTKTTRFAIGKLRPKERNPNWQEMIGDDNGEPAASHEALYFLARLPPGAFVKGRNEVTVHTIVSDESGEAVSLLDFNFE